MTNKEEFVKHFGISKKVEIEEDEVCIFNTEKCASILCEDCEYYTFWSREYKPEVKYEKEADRQSDRRNLSSIDIYNYLRTANPGEYGVIYSIVAYKLSETMDFKDFLTMVFANLFAVSDKFDAEVMYKAQEMILKHYGEEG